MRRFLSDYAMLPVLLLLCLVLSILTIDEQKPTGAAAAKSVASGIGKDRVVVIVQSNDEDRAYAEALRAALPVVEVAVVGGPPEARKALERLAGKVDVAACTSVTGAWPAVQVPGIRVVAPVPYRGSNFLKADNLWNVANQIAVIALVAIGMSMVIIAGQIDLSVGSLVALSAVVAALILQKTGGAEATAAGIVIASGAAILVCAAAGLVSGLLVTAFGLPAFLSTLGMMLVASGAAYMLSGGQSIYQVPKSFGSLGRGSVVLMGVLYVLAHFFMAKTVPGRYLYAVGGNAEAARLSGVPVKRVLLFAFAVSGALAGLGGIITASQLSSGAPTYGLMYELYVIAAVVVGGTSLAGGKGRIFGTLIGAFIMGVIQNGMNLLGVGSYAQKVVLGLVILGAAVADGLKKQTWWRRREAK